METLWFKEKKISSFKTCYKQTILDTYTCTHKEKKYKNKPSIDNKTSN